jgi:3-deoxy-D-manno-octulosonic-acid transferase
MTPLTINHSTRSQQPIFTHPLDRMLFSIYTLGWRVAIPLLKHNQRLAKGFDQRILADKPSGPVDLWIQAASAGEAYLAKALLERLKPTISLRIHLTANTGQGIQILDRIRAQIMLERPFLRITRSFFPFDHPGIMRRTVDILAPKVMVLLETEIWPGLLFTLKRKNIPTLIINARLTPKSLERYLIRPTIWSALAPSKIWAISKSDGQRFQRLFGYDRIAYMPNMKFDRVVTFGDAQGPDNPLRPLLPSDGKIVVLGSVRTAEEAAVEKLILYLKSLCPDAIIALFPRHLTRLQHWENFFEAKRINWVYRSRAQTMANAGQAILWDRFGELSWAYALAKAAFVGGSLTPLGGQNFLEPLAVGIRPVIGPHWDNFAWVGADIMRQGLVQQVDDWQDAANILASDLVSPAAPDGVRRRIREYIDRRKGGTSTAASAVMQYLNSTL